GTCDGVARSRRVRRESDDRDGVRGAQKTLDLRGRGVLEHGRGRPGGEGRPSVAEVSASADQLVLAYHERDAFGAEDCGAVADVEVQVRLGAVTGVAQEAKYLAALNTIPGFHAKAARLQV